MKVAVMLTGFLRTYEEAFNLLKINLLDRYNPDLYISTWDKSENGILIKKNFIDLYKNYNLKNVLIEDIDKYNQEKFIIKKIDRFNDIFDINPRANQHGEYWANRLKDQWYLVKKLYLVIENEINYDIIIRLRFDLFIESINLSINKGITVPFDIGGWDFTDHMAYGDPTSMKKYCSLHDYIYELYLNHNIDITHAVDMPKYYLQNFQESLNIYRDSSIKYHIRK